LGTIQIFIIIVFLSIFDQWPGIQAPLSNQQQSVIAINAGLPIIFNCTATGFLKHSFSLSR
jgi:hypothetical protein